MIRDEKGGGQILRVVSQRMREPIENRLEPDPQYQIKTGRFYRHALKCTKRN